MFSATFPDDIKRLADQILKTPVRIQVARRITVTELVSHSAFKVDERRKREVLERIMRERDLRQVLCFTSTKISANRLARELLRDGFACAALHSDKSQQERMQALADFKDGKVQVLVATDIAARGLDIEQTAAGDQLRAAAQSRGLYSSPRPHRPRRRHRVRRSRWCRATRRNRLRSIEKLLKAPIHRARCGRSADVGASSDIAVISNRGADGAQIRACDSSSDIDAAEPMPTAPRAPQRHASSGRAGRAHDRARLAARKPREHKRQIRGAVPAAGRLKNKTTDDATYLSRMFSREPTAAAARFRDLIDRPDEDIDLAEAALLIAKNAKRDLDVARYLSQIDSAFCAARINALPMPCSETDRILALNQFLVSTSRASLRTSTTTTTRATAFCNEVLERRVGIPISLSILYIEIGRRIGLPLKGSRSPAISW